MSRNLSVLLVPLLVLATALPMSDDLSGLNLEYTVTINDPTSHRVQIGIVCRNVPEDNLVLETSEFRGRFIAPENLRATDPIGNLLPVTTASDSEPYGLAWNISTQGNDPVIITYEVDPSTVIGTGDVHGYISDTFGLAEGQTLFLVPLNQGAQSMTPLVDIGEIKVRFDVPSDWEVYTPWKKMGEYYYPELESGLILNSLSFAPIVLGGFNVISRTINGVNVAIATYRGWDIQTQEQAAQTAWEIFEYQAALFNGEVGSEYLAIFSPRTDEGALITTGEWSLGHTTAVQYCGTRAWFPWDLFSHGVFHRWNIWEPWGMHGYGQWFIEGSDVFYESRILAKLRLASPGNLWLWRSQDGSPQLLDTSGIEVSVTNGGQSIGLKIPLQILGGPTNHLEIRPYVIAAHDFELLDAFDPEWITVPTVPSGPPPLLAIDPAGDSQWSSAGADLVTLYGKMDSYYVESRLDVIGSANSALRYDFYLSSPTGGTYQIGYSPVAGFIDQVVSRLQGDYDRYLQEYANTPRDVPLIDATDPFLVYRKSASVILTMAREIYERTEGAVTIDNLMHFLYENCGNHVQSCNEEYIRYALNLLTGSDFTSFFNAHIYGVTTLNMDWAFEDGDQDGLQSAIEVLLDIDFNSPDTDGDGADDGIEVMVGTDPINPLSYPREVYLPLIMH